MRDITRSFEEAAKRSREWGCEAVRATTERLLTAVRGATVDWDRDCGEDWASVRWPDAAGNAIVHVRGPVGLVDERLDWVPDVCPDVIWVPFKEWGRPEFKLEKSVAEAFCKRPLTDAIDWDCASAWDLWYAMI